MTTGTTLALAVFAFLIGILLSLIVFIIFYMINFGPFQYCSYNQPTCLTGQYINNPTNAIKQGYNISDILFIESNKMMYKRPLKQSCAPGENQTIHMKYPQYCTFKYTDGQGNTSVVEGRDILLDANRYKIDNVEGFIETSGDCVPTTSNYQFNSIELKWD